MTGFDQSQLIGSIDSISMVRNCDSAPRAEELSEREFKHKPGKFPGTTTWYHNGEDSTYMPQVTFYQTYARYWRFRVDVSIPKLTFGDNILLPSKDQIREAIYQMSNSVEIRSGLRFDAPTADVCRVDYAVNIPCDRERVAAFIAYYARFDIPRMLRKPIGNETVYFDNKSRGIRLYNKLAETEKKQRKRPDLIEKAAGKVRAEYYASNQTAVGRFAKQRGLVDSTVSTIVSPEVIDSVTGELLGLLQLDKVDLSAGDNFRSILAKTGDVKATIGVFGFMGAVEALGEDFYQDPALKYSKSTYDRNRRECQSLGISL